MKQLYLIQGKEVKKQILNDFKKLNDNSEVIRRLTRLKIMGTFGLVMGIIIFIYDLISGSKWYEYLSDTALILASIFFVYKSTVIKINILNNYLINNKKKYSNLKSN